MGLGPPFFPNRLLGQFIVRLVRQSSLVFLLLLAVAKVMAAPPQELLPSKQSDSLAEFDDAMAALAISDLDSGGGAYALSVEKLYVRLRDQFYPFKELEDAQLQGIFRAIVSTTFYTNSSDYLLDLIAASSELSTRGLLTEARARDVKDSLIRIRAFDELNRLSDEGLLEVRTRLPRLRYSDDFVADKPAIIRLGTSKNELIVTNAKLPGGVGVVATFGPYCAPSRRALKAISSDAEMSAFFRDRALWLIPVGAEFHSERMKEVTQAAAGQVGVAYNTQSWSQVDSWSTPMFYILHDGEVVDVMRGWPSDARLGELRRMIRAASDGSEL